MIETVQIALWGSALSIVVGVPCGLLSSNNIAPAWVVQPMLRLMDACRAIHERVFAILFVAAVGLGPFARVMALCILDLCALSKPFSAAIAALHPPAGAGIRPTGQTRRTPSRRRQVEPETPRMD